MSFLFIDFFLQTTLTAIFLRHYSEIIRLRSAATSQNIPQSYDAKIDATFEDEQSHDHPSRRPRASDARFKHATAIPPHERTSDAAEMVTPSLGGRARRIRQCPFGTVHARNQRPHRRHARGDASSLRAVRRSPGPSRNLRGIWTGLADRKPRRRPSRDFAGRQQRVLTPIQNPRRGHARFVTDFKRLAIAKNQSMFDLRLTPPAARNAMQTASRPS